MAGAPITWRSGDRLQQQQQAQALPPPLAVTFAPTQVFPPNTPHRPHRPTNHVWVAGVASLADEGEVLRCCKEGNIPAPEHLLKVVSIMRGGTHVGAGVCIRVCVVCFVLHRDELFLNACRSCAPRHVCVRCPAAVPACCWSFATRRWQRQQ